MPQSLARALSISRCVQAAQSFNAAQAGHFSTSSTLLLPRKTKEAPSETPVMRGGRRRISVLEEDMDELWEQLEEPGDVEDSPSGGHIILQKQRTMLHYMRLIEHEMPKLVAYRKPFVPPSEDAPIIVRSMHYQGEAHPAIVKRAIVVPLDSLPLKSEEAIHKFKLLAGPRWTPTPPADSGVSGLANWGDGYIKISCEDFPKPSQNLKWASDTLDKLVEEANNGKDTFSDVPLDLRHIFAKAKKAKKGDHLGNRVFQRPTVRDFPQEWLPPTATAT